MNVRFGRTIELWLIVMLAGMVGIGVALVLLRYAGIDADTWIRTALFLGALLVTWGWRMRTVHPDTQPAIDRKPDVDAQIRAWAERWW